MNDVSPSEPAAEIAEDEEATTPKDDRCRWCRRPLPDQSGPGRPRVFCKRSCRQRDFEARSRAAERGLGEHELIMTREALDALRDDLYVLVCAVNDADRDLAEAKTVTDYRDALRWVLDAARPLVARSDSLVGDTNS